MATKCRENGGETGILRRAQIAAECNLSAHTAKTGVRRLREKNLISCVNFSHSCQAGGSNYRLQKEGRKIIQNWPDNAGIIPETLVEAKQVTGTRDTRHARDTRPPARERAVCLFVNKNKTNKQTLPELEREMGAREQPSSLQAETLPQLQSSVDQLGLDDDLKLSGNDLAAALEASGCALDEFLASVEHLAFYLRSAEAKGIRSPKTWMLKKLRKGYFGPPADFVSFEERLEAEKTRAKKERVERLRRAQLASFEADFEAWQLEQSPQQLAGLKRELGPALSLQPNSAISRALLRRHFAASTGREHLLGGDEDPDNSRQRP